MKKSILKVWTFLSDSSPTVSYQTLQYTDGTTSCDCRGWTRRVAANGSRSCKHTRWVDMGSADRHCSATRDYSQPQPPSIHNHAQRKLQITPRLGQRKFAV